MVRSAPAHRNPEDARDYVRCRTLGHAWDAIPVTEPPSYGVAIDLRCEHCTTIRRDIVSPYNGQMLGRRYIYPDHYRDTEHQTRSDWRAMFVTTLADHLKAMGHEAPALKVIPGQRKQAS